MIASGAEPEQETSKRLSNEPIFQPHRRRRADTSFNPGWPELLPQLLTSCCPRYFDRYCDTSAKSKTPILGESLFRIMFCSMLDAKSSMFSDRT